MYSACVRASTQCRQFPNSDKLSTGGLNEERNSESLFLSCMMSSTEFSVNALGMSPGHVHMTNMTLWGYVRKCAETHCLNYRMAKNGSVEVIFMSPSSRRRRSSISTTCVFYMGGFWVWRGLRKRRHSGFRRVFSIE